MIIFGKVFRSLFIVALAFLVLWSSWPAGRGFATFNSLPTPDLIRVALVRRVVIREYFVWQRWAGWVVPAKYYQKVGPDGF